MKENWIKINVAYANAMTFQCDALVLKYAQHLYGLDAAVYSGIAMSAEEAKLPQVGRHTIISSNGVVAAKKLHL